MNTVKKPSVERLTALAQTISEKTKVLTKFLNSKSIDAASFDVDGLAEFPISPDDEVPFKARLELADAAKELHDIATGPKESLRNLAWDSCNSLSLKATWTFKVAQAVPLKGSISYENLTAKVAEANGIPVNMYDLRRLLRHAMTNRLFVEPTKGQVAHSRASRLLVEDELMENWIGFMCGDLWLPVAKVVDAMKKWPASEEPTETGVNLAYHHSTPWFDWLQEDPARNKQYNLAMQAHGGAAGYSADLVVTGYPWGELGEGVTVVDMGGNQGYISFAIAEAFPQLTLIVQDQAGMRQPATIGTVPAHLASRVRLTTHDFFTPQPEVAAAYLFRMIFHGFADKYCVQILQALVPALRRGARVIVDDGCLPEPGTATYLEERALRTLDLFMHVTVNAREREADDWKGLFARADPRYRVNRVWQPPRSVMWFVEAEWTGD